MSKKERQRARPDLVAEYCRRSYAKLRAAALAPYGDRCACCSALEGLTLDHIAGNGGEQRRAVGTAAGLYRWIIANRHPAGFQILCGPCNRSKGRGTRCTLDHARILPRAARRILSNEQRLAAEVQRLYLENARLRLELAQLRGDAS